MKHSIYSRPPLHILLDASWPSGQGVVYVGDVVIHGRDIFEKFLIRIGLIFVLKITHWQQIILVMTDAIAFVTRRQLHGSSDVIPVADVVRVAG